MIASDNFVMQTYILTYWKLKVEMGDRINFPYNNRLCSSKVVYNISFVYIFVYYSEVKEEEAFLNDIEIYSIMMKQYDFCVYLYIYAIV